MATPTFLLRLRDSFAANFAALFASVSVLHGTRPPYANEWIYLLRLVKVYRPDYLLNDASFSVPGSEHWLFNHLFGLTTFLLPIEAVAWCGRSISWAILLYALMRLARLWKIPMWSVSIALLLWLASGQSIVAEEWIIGTFEAKCVAYICLLFALDGLARQRSAYPAVLLGLTFSFHPAVGIWGIAACGAALLFCRTKLARLLKVAALTFVFALPGLAALLSEGAATASVEDWKFIELVRFPHLFDPFAWPKGGVILVMLQLACCLWAYFRSDKKETSQRFLTGFVTALGVFFVSAYVLRSTGQYELLRLMPGRLFPVFIPLFFLFTLTRVYANRGLDRSSRRILAAAGIACLLLSPSPVSKAGEQLSETYRSWTTPPDDTAVCYRWLRDNTPNGTIVIAPPWRQDLWYYSERAQVASSGFPTYLDLKEWRERVELLSGESLTNRNRLEVDRRPDVYNSLTPEQIDSIAKRSGASLLVTEGRYQFPTLFESGNSRIYRIR